MPLCALQCKHVVWLEGSSYISEKPGNEALKCVYKLYIREIVGGKESCTQELRTYSSLWLQSSEAPFCTDSSACTAVQFAAAEHLAQGNSYRD